MNTVLVFLVVVLTLSGLLWLMNSRFGGVVLRVLMLCWGLGLGVFGIASLWGALQCLRPNNPLAKEPLINFLGVAILAAIGLGALYGAYRLLLAVSDENWND
jgi:hypothetical protein